MLSDKQREALTALVEGTATRVDGRPLRALERMGYVNKHGIATTRGWHAVDKKRYTPPVRVPLDWEVERWRGQYLYVVEEPEREHDKHGNPRHIAKTFTVWLDVYKMMRFYQACKKRERELVDDMWTKSDDNAYEEEVRYGWHTSHGRYYDRLVLDAREEGVAQVANAWGIYYTADYYYRWAGDLFTLLDLGREHRARTTSYKYSLQDNQDEVEVFDVPGLEGPDAASGLMAIIHVT